MEKECKSSDPERGYVYYESFIVHEYEGTYAELEEKINELDGIFEVTVKIDRGYPEDPVGGDVDVSIVYDTLLTDRTQFHLAVEYFENTNGEVHSA